MNHHGGTETLRRARNSTTILRLKKLKSKKEKELKALSFVC